MAAAHRVQGGQQKLKQYANAFARAEREYGVPPPVIAAFWGLETDFGGNSGKLPILKSLATLAYDCRRPDRFHEELIAALKIVDRGDLSPERDDRLVGRRTRPDAVSAEALLRLCGRLRRRRPPRPDPQRRRRDRLDRALHLGRAEVAARRAVAAGSPCAVQPAVGPDRSVGQASALEMGAVGRDLSGRTAAAERQHAGVGAAADGQGRSGVPRLCQLRRLHRME